MYNFIYKKSVLRGLLALLTLALLTSCGSKSGSSAGSTDDEYYHNDQAVKLFSWALENLNKTTHTIIDEYDTWPESEVRLTGSHLASLISKKTMEELWGCPIYLSGPHYDNGWNLWSEEFGHYNPEAIKRFISLERQVLSNESLVEKTRPLVDQYLKDKMICLIVIYQTIHDGENHEDVEGYLDYGSVLYNKPCFVRDLPIYHRYGDYWISFWVRRMSDGTDDLIYEAIYTAYTTYYGEEGLVCDDYDYDQYDVEPDYYDEEMDEDNPNPACDYFMTTVEGRDEKFYCTDGWDGVSKFAKPTFRDAVEKLDTTGEDGDYDSWAFSGLRIMGEHLFNLLSIREVEQLIGCPLYVSGPHKSYWNLNNEDEYGKYNITAIKRLKELADEILTDESFVNKTRPLIEKFLKLKLQYTLAIHQNLVETGKMYEYYDMLESGTYNYIRVPVVGDYPCYEDDTYLFANTSQSIQYFWIRRHAEGTEGLIYDLLLHIYDVYFHETNLKCK